MLRPVIDAKKKEGIQIFYRKEDEGLFVKTDGDRVLIKLIQTHKIIQGATKKHARLRPFPFLCEILIQFHEKIIKFDQIFVKQKIRV